MRVLQGTISQASSCLPALNRNYQCTGIAAAACCALILDNPAQWTTSKIDEVVTVGDRLYRDSWNKLPQPPHKRNEMLSPEELLNNAPFQPSVPFKVDLRGTVTGCLTSTAKLGFDLPNLQQGLHQLFQTHQAGILITSSFSVAVCKSNTGLFLFDSHSRNQQGLPQSNGTAVLIELLSVRELVKHVHQLAQAHGQLYELTGISVGEPNGDIQTSPMPADSQLEYPTANSVQAAVNPHVADVIESSLIQIPVNQTVASTTEVLSAQKSIGLNEDENSMEIPKSPPKKKRRMDAKDKARQKKQKQRQQKANKRKDDSYRKTEAERRRQQRLAANSIINENETNGNETQNKDYPRQQHAKRMAQKRAQNTDFYQKELSKNTERIASRRAEDPDFRERGLLQNAKRKGTRRAEDPDFRERELFQNAERIAARRAEDPDFRERELFQNAERIANRRAEDPDFREREFLENAQRIPTRRAEDPDFHERELLANAERIATRRSEDPDFRHINNVQSLHYLNMRRSDEHFLLQEAEAAADRRRTLTAAADYHVRYLQLETEYRQRIHEGPTLVCVSCGQLCFKNSAKIKSEIALSSACTGFNWRVVCKLHVSSSEDLVLCTTCYKYIIKSKIPPLALINGLEFPSIPDELKDLTPLEERLVSPRIPFMQIRELGYGRQYGLRGSCVNVGVDVNTSVSILPRLQQDAHTIYVQILRRMSDQHPYAFQAVRPNKVHEAARYLIQTEMYKKHEIALSDEFLLQFSQLTQNLLDTCAASQSALEQVNITDNSRTDEVAAVDQTIIGTERNENGENWNDFTEEEAMLQNQETLLDEICIPDTGIRIAPGEGKTPMSLLFDEDVQELSFPSIYCGEMRPVKDKISLAQIAKSEARMYDRRCSLNVPHMFLTFCRLRRQKIVSAISTSLRKKRRRQTLTVSDVLNNATVDDLVQHNDGYKILQVDRSSPAYWESKKKMVFAMIRQFGLPTLFLTLSCAETRWLELLVILKLTVDKEEISLEEASRLTPAEKVRLIQSDAYTITRYFTRRIAELWKLLKAQGGPFHNYRMTHDFKRFEFQQRGSVHCHAILWLEGAPRYDESDPSSAEKCERFVDEFITCKEDAAVGDAINVQYHKHITRICHREVRGQSVCRFGVPWPPMRKTMILKPLDDTISETDKKCFKKDYKSMSSELKSLLTARQFLTFDQFLDKLGWTEEEYILRIRSQLLKPKLFLQREVKEQKLNAYNKDILVLHDANMDIQFILDAYACAVYVVDYVNKSDRGISKLLRETAENVRAGNAPVAEQLRAVSNVFVNKSEISAQEAAFHILSLPLSISSDGETYINTSPPEDRTRMIKSARELREMADLDPDNTDILVAGLLEHYQQRPDVLESCCLADFAAWYNYSKRNRRANQPRRPVEDEDIDNELQQETQEREEISAEEQNTSNCGGKVLKLKDSSGFVTKRTKPKVIRYRNYSATQDVENYMRECLMLFTPWREETSLLNNTRNLYLNARDTIKEIRARYVKLNIDFDQLIDEVLQREAQEQWETEDGGPPDDFAIYELNREQQADIGHDLPADIRNANPPQSERFLLPRYQPNDEYCTNIARLNERQRRYHLNLMHIFKTRPQEAVHHFVSGGAGVGKSMLISVITQSSIRIFNDQLGSHPDDLTVLLMAPTGKAAFNIGGVTLHSALHIYGQNRHINLDADTLNSLRSKLRHLRLIIIDEISMVGRGMFQYVDQRLRQIFDTRTPMGGVSVLVFGDFNQLRPVQDQWIFHAPTDALGVLAGSYLWHLFSYYNLTEIMRQREDARMAEALSRLAVGQSTADDDAMFEARELTKLAAKNEHPPLDAVELFETNAQADAHNAHFLSLLNTESCESLAFDFCEGDGSDAMKQKQLDKIRDWPLSSTQNLPRQLIAKLTARYMLTINIQTTDGLTNGACGTLRHITWGRMGDGRQVALRLYIQFDEEAVGRATRNDKRDAMRRDGVNSHLWTPIERVSRPIIPSKGSLFKIIRKQFPLVPAKGITIHKSQGSTFTSAIVHIRQKKMDRRSMYVAFSRVTSLSGLYINGKYSRPSPPLSTDVVMQEMHRLVSENPWSFTLKFPELHQDVGVLNVLCHNIRSLHKHHMHVLNDKSYINSDIIMICETWTMPGDNISIPGYDEVHRRNCLKDTRHAYGTVIYVRESISPNLIVFYQQAENEMRGNKLHAFLDIVGFFVRSKEIVGIIFLHKSPKCSINILKSQLDRCLDAAVNKKIDKLVVAGDFNLNILDEHIDFRLSEIMAERRLLLSLNKECSTTDANTLIDLIYSNFTLTEANVLESVISDHKPLWFQIPYFE